MLNPSLLDPSGFLTANITPYMETPFPDAPQAQAPQQRFSEFLAALEGPAEAVPEGPLEAAPVRDGQVAAENADEEEYSTAVAVEAVIIRDVPAAEAAVRPDEGESIAVSDSVEADDEADGVAAAVDSEAENGVAASVETAVKAGEAAELAAAANAEPPPEELAQAAPLADGQDKLVRQQADAGWNADEAKTRSVEPPSADTKSTEVPALDAGSGLYVDESIPVTDERLAAADRENPAENAARRGGGAAAEGLAAEGGTDEAATPALFTAAIESVAASPPVTEKAGATAEKKPSSERGRRNTADERRGVSATGGNAAAQPVETFEARRVSADGPAEAEITVNLRGQARDVPVDGRGDGAKPAASFETLLARELQQNLNGSIVRQAQVMLREGGEGTIRLSLKPESLGKVKIHLEMAENKITGKIVVESGEALRAFEHEMRSLEQTFRGEGFDGASLSLELGGERQNDEGRQQGGGEYGATRTASSRYGETAAVAFFGASYSAKQVNVLV